ncbi:hypothetical protein [Methanopyrus sp.]
MSGLVWTWLVGFMSEDPDISETAEESADLRRSRKELFRVGIGQGCRRHGGAHGGNGLHRGKTSAAVEFGTPERRGGVRAAFLATGQNVSRSGQKRASWWIACS